MKKYRISIFLAVFLLCLSPVCLSASMGNSLIFKDEVEVPIIMYHFLSKNITNPNKWEIGPEVFEQDLQYILDAGYEPVFMRDLIDFVYQGKRLPEKPIVITFDDGDSCVHRYAYPLLQQYNAKAVISVIGKPTDLYSQDDRTDLKYFPNLTWDQLRELQSSGLVEVQNHSYDLHHDGGASIKNGESFESYRTRLSEDVCHMQTRINEELDIPATTFTFPYGKYNQETPVILTECGIQATLTCNEKTNHINIGNPNCLYGMGRFLRPDNKTTEAFFKEILQLEGSD